MVLLLPVIETDLHPEERQGHMLKRVSALAIVLLFALCLASPLTAGVAPELTTTAAIMVVTGAALVISVAIRAGPHHAAKRSTQDQYLSAATITRPRMRRTTGKHLDRLPTSLRNFLYSLGIHDTFYDEARTAGRRLDIRPTGPRKFATST